MTGTKRKCCNLAGIVIVMNAEQLRTKMALNASYLDEIDRIPYEPRAIANFEALCLWTMIDHCRPQILIESGVCRGRSTVLLCEAALKFGVEHVYAFDLDPEFEEYTRTKLGGYENVSYEIGDSAQKIQVLSKNLENKSVGLFLDGPKQGKPLRNLMQSISRLPNVAFIASHDCHPKRRTREDFSNGYKDYFDNKKHHFLYTDRNFWSGQDLNAKLRLEMNEAYPEALYTLNDIAYHMGIIYRENV